MASVGNPSSAMAPLGAGNETAGVSQCLSGVQFDRKF